MLKKKLFEIENENGTCFVLEMTYPEKNRDKTEHKTESKLNTIREYRYDMIAACLDFGIEEHPQIQMKKLGFNVIKSEPISVANCWIFKVDNNIENIPGYLTEVNY